MTAAHCVEDDQSPYTVVLGDVLRDAIEPSETHIAVDRVVRHPNYNFWSNDVALLHLASPAPINDAIDLVQLPSTRITTGTARVSGWGYTLGTVQHDGSNHLLYADLPIEDDRVCAEDLFFELGEDEICAGVPQGEKGACYGDSGGPLVVGETQIGIVKGGAYNCDSYTVFTDVFSVLDFIQQTIEGPSSKTLGATAVAVTGSITPLAGISLEAPDPNINTVLASQGVPELSSFGSTELWFFTDGRYESVWKVGQIPQEYPEYQHLSFKWLEAEQLDISTRRLTPGIAFFVESPENTNTLMTFAGEAKSDAPITLKINNGFNMLAYPFAAPIRLNDMTFAASGALGNVDADHADQIHVRFRLDANDFRVFQLMPSQGVDPVVAGQWVESTDLTTPTDFALQPGEGFWYQHRGGGMDWTEVPPYTVPADTVVPSFRIEAAEEGVLTLSMDVPAGETILLKSSSDLTHWRSDEVIVGDGGTLTRTRTATVGAQFYRVETVN